MIAAAVRPDIPEVDVVRAKFEAYHRGTPFEDEAAEDSAWELWLLREQPLACRNRFKRYTEPLEAVAPGAFLAGLEPRAHRDDLNAEYQVIRND